MPSSNQRAQGMPGASWHPRSRVQDALRNAHTSIQVQSEHSGIPCAMVLRLMPCSPRRRIPLASVAGELAARIARLSFANLRRLHASHGRQDHTVLPYATPVFVKRLRRYQVQVRRSIGKGGSVVRLRAVVHSRQSRPANTLHADAAASTASHPASVTTRDPPLVRDETADF